MSAIVDDDVEAKVPLWNDPKVRALVSQAILIIAVGLFFWVIISNTLANMERQKIASGFGFLSTTAGFAIGQTLIEYSEASTYLRTFWVGLLNTILVSVIGIFFATALGFSIGVMRLSKNWVISKIATVYVETLRNIPLLLQIFFWYFGVLSALPGVRDSKVWLGGSVFLNNRGLYLPRPVFEDNSGFVGIALLIGIAASFVVRAWAKKRQEATGEQFPVFLTALGLIIGLPLLAYLVTGFPISLEYATKGTFNLTGGTNVNPEFMALLVALSFYTATFIAEIVRAGILAVDHGQTEAAGALGLSRGKTLRLVVIPQALRVIIPPLTSQYLNLTKNSSLAVAIAYPDLVAVFAGTVLNQTGQAIEVLLMTMAVYLSLSLLMSMFMNWYNARKALTER